ncbi:hypothetical protein AAY473_000896 [Plecturocebus cupreus]
MILAHCQSSGFKQFSCLSLPRNQTRLPGQVRPKEIMSVDNKLSESHSVTQAGVQWPQSRLTATSASRVQAILLPEPPE